MLYKRVYLATMERMTKKLHTVVLVGNPNVGKSSLFSRLTGTNVITSNFPGTTLSVTRGVLELRRGGVDYAFELIDIPGLYSLTEKTETSQRGARFVIEQADVILNIADATNLKQSLYLTKQLQSLKRPLIVALNMSDEAGYHGITIDTAALGETLSCPVIATAGISGMGMSKLVDTLTALPIPTCKKAVGRIPTPRWPAIKALIAQVQTVTDRQKRFHEHLATWSVHPIWGTLLALGIFVGTLVTIFYLSASLESVTEAIFTWTLTKPLCMLHRLLSWSPFLQQTLVGTVENGTINFETAMGLFSTGLYIPLGQVAPPVIAFYSIMGLLEDSGYLPRLALVADNLMHRYALHGVAIMPMLLGAGCNVTGIIGTRVLDNRRQRIITATLLSIAIPCTSQTGFIMAMTEKMGGFLTTMLFFTLIAVWHMLGLIFGHRERNNYQEMVMEIPPLRSPRLQPSLRKLWYRARDFLEDAIPITIAGIGILLVLNYFAVLELLGQTVFSFLHTLWGLPHQVIPALFMGLFRKEIALSFLKMIPNLTRAQAFISTLLLTLWFPCISVYTILYKEFGLATLGRLVALMFGVSTAIGVAAHMLLTTFG